MCVEDIDICSVFALLHDLIYVYRTISSRLPTCRCEITTIKKAGEWALGGFFVVAGIIILSGLAQGVRKRVELEMPKPVEPRRIKKKLQKQVE